MRERDRATVERGSGPSGRRLHVSLDDGRVFRFARSFSIGRGDDCDVRLDNSEVSRNHVVVSSTGGRWTWRDHSRNGVFVDGEPLEEGDVTDSVTLTLGEEGPAVTLAIQVGSPSRVKPSRPPAEPKDESETGEVERFRRRRGRRTRRPEDDHDPQSFRGSPAKTSAEKQPVDWRGLAGGTRRRRHRAVQLPAAG
jgi:pSer/pThr/pTyr-binding forkhead associated (FHA) protein